MVIQGNVRNRKTQRYEIAKRQDKAEAKKVLIKLKQTTRKLNPNKKNRFGPSLFFSRNPLQKI